MNIHLGGARKTIINRNNVKFCVIVCLVLIATFVSIGTASIVEPHYVNSCEFCESTPDAVVTTSTCDLSIAYNEIVNENGVLNPLFKSVVQMNNPSDSVAAIVESEKQLGSSAEEYWAVIVGGNSLYARHDAEDMHNVLTMASENWDADHIRFLVNESATKANIRDAIRWMANNANTEDTCLFFFSGHGEQSIDDNGDELDGLDESLRTYYNETILDDELEEWIGDVKAEKVVAILEACYCGGVLTIFQIEEVPDRDGFAQDLEKANCVVFAACRVNEVSYNLQVLKNGIFSYYIVQGLWSVADHNTDGKISIRELYDYSYPKVVGSTETLIDQEVYNPQHPLLWPEDDIADNIYIIKLKAPAPKKISVPVEYRTIQEAIEAAMPGDTIEVAPGTYNENVILNKPLIINAPYRDSIIHAANNSLPCVFITVDNTSISGLTCRNGSDGIRLFMSNNTVISNNIANYNHYQGIRLWTSNENIIANNTAMYNEWYGIYLKESHDNRITDNDASNSVDYAGIGLNSSNDNEIRNNIANSNNLEGIRLSSHSDNNILANNIANSNKEAGILCWTSSANILTYNNVNSNDKGIWLYKYSTENIITSNTAKYNDRTGICLEESNDNSITDNDASNSANYNGIQLNASSNNEIRNNTANYNHYNGIGLWTSSNNNTIAYNTANGNGYRGIRLKASDNNRVIYNNASDSTNYDGIYLYSANNNEIRNNIANSNNDDGIDLWSSSDNIITNNTAKNNSHGISLNFSSNNIIRGNNAHNNGYMGILLLYSDNNTVRNNLMTSNFYNFGVDGESESDFYNDIDTSNLVDGKPIYYLVDTSGIIINSSSNAGTVYCINCNAIMIKDLNLTNSFVGIGFYNTNNSRIENNNLSENLISIAFGKACDNTIVGNNASNNFLGISIFNNSNSNAITGNKVCNNFGGIFILNYSNNNAITGNNASNNFLGISFLNSSNSNVITGNKVCDNFDGIFFENSSSNKIYLNNFISNSVNLYSGNSTNIWNSSEKITYNYKRKTNENYLGNHWGNYMGSDRNNDGIGDTPYNIDTDSDNYPLMASFEDFLLVETIFDTGTSANPYPSIQGTHEGKIIPSCDIVVSKMYTYSCVGTGGHTRSIKIYENGDLKVSGNWTGYQADWENITITPSVTLKEGHEYRYVIETGSYPQIIHVPEYQAATSGTITCDEFTDVNGKIYSDWIPAIRLS